MGDFTSTNKPEYPKIFKQHFDTTNKSWSSMPVDSEIDENLMTKVDDSNDNLLSLNLDQQTPDSELPKPVSSSSNILELPIEPLSDGDDNTGIPDINGMMNRLMTNMAQTNGSQINGSQTGGSHTGGSQKNNEDDNSSSPYISNELYDKLMKGGAFEDDDDDVFDELKEQSSSTTSDMLRDDDEMNDISDEDKIFKKQGQKPKFEQQPKPKPKFEPKKREETSSISVESDANPVGQAYGYSETSSEPAQDSVNTSDINLVALNKRKR